MKIISCSNCGQKIRIPDDKHIRFKCPNSLCRREYEYKNGKKLNPSILKYSIPAFAILIAIIGSFFTYLFPIPLTAGITWFTWWISNSSKKVVIKLLSSLSLSTAIGLSLLLIIQLTLNFISNPKSIEIPNWLLHIDNFLIWSSKNLTYISEISLCFYLIIIISLLYVAYKKPTWKPVSKFVTLEGWVGKITSVLIVITSFTFFGPSTLDKAIENEYHRHYKVAYREKLEQDRRRLIADVLRKQIEDNDTTNYVANLSVFLEDVKTVSNTDINVSNEAKQDVESVMLLEGEFKAKNTEYYTHTDWAGSDENLEKNWKQESKRWEYNYSGEVKKEKENKPEGYSVQNNRRSFTEAKIAEVKKATILADEAVEGLKAVFLKFCGGLAPDMETVFGKYIEEVVNATAEYIFDVSKVDNIVRQFFNYTRSIGKVDVFGRIANWWQKIVVDKQKQADEKIAQEREKIIEKERLIEEKKANEQEKAFERENHTLVKRLEDRISKLDVDMPDKLEEIKESLEKEQAKTLTEREVRKAIKEKAHDDIRQLVIENDISANAKERNGSLKNNLDIVSKAKNVKDVLKAFEVTSSFPICPICHMPAIPGTPCIVRF